MQQPEGSQHDERRRHVNGPRLIVLRLVGGADEGKWMYVDHTPLRAYNCNRGNVREVTLVTTGDVEWGVNDTCAEVCVPADKIDLWRAEHAC